MIEYCFLTAQSPNNHYPQLFNIKIKAVYRTCKGTMFTDKTINTQVKKNACIYLEH